MCVRHVFNKLFAYLITYLLTCQTGHRRGSRKDYVVVDGAFKRELKLHGVLIWSRYNSGIVRLSK